jgi:group I intron endonuclease
VKIDLRDYQSSAFDQAREFIRHGKAGVYRIVSPSGKCYVGSSIDMAARFRTHRYDLRRGRHHARALQAAAAKYGVHALRFEPIVCALDKKSLVALEQFLIDELKPQYNSTRTAACPLHDPCVAERLANSIRSSAAHRDARNRNRLKAHAVLSKAVVRLTDGVVFASSYEAARAMGATKRLDGVSGAIASGYRYAGHYWAYEGSGVTLRDRVAATERRVSDGAAKSKATMVEARRRAIKRIDDEHVFASIAEAARSVGCNHAAIHRSLKFGTRCMGSVWAYV